MRQGSLIFDILHVTLQDASMRKELFVAIVLGFGIGLVVVFGIITARSALRKHNAVTNNGTTSSTISPTPSVIAAATNALTIMDPQDGEVVMTDKVTLRGKTSPGANIVISTEKTDVLTAADDSGSFSSDVSLLSGANDIQVVSFNTSGDRSDTQLTVVYSTADF